MRCMICHGGEIQLAHVTEDLVVGADIVQVTVNVFVCRSCGERYYDRKTMRHLEVIEQELKEGRAHLKEIGKVLAYE